MTGIYYASSLPPKSHQGEWMKIHQNDWQVKTKNNYKLKKTNKKQKN